MTPAEALLAELRSRGVELETDGARLRWRPRGAVTPALAEQVREHKAELVALLDGLRKPPLSSDQAEAERLLAELRGEIDGIKADSGGRLPRAVVTLLADALVIGERFVRDRGAEAARGWDALELLRGLPQLVQEIMKRWRQQTGTAHA
jgi:hypothetical protein